MMNIDQFKLVVEGWGIMTESVEARQCIRRLCRWFILVLDASEVCFEHPLWRETIRQDGALLGKEIWTRVVPHKNFRWVFTGGIHCRNQIGPVVDLLSVQWLYLHSLMPSKKLRRLPSPHINHTDWIAVSRSSRMVLQKLPYVCQSLKPLLLLGSPGSGKSYLARIIHYSGPNHLYQFSDTESFSEQGTLYIHDWRKMTNEDQKKVLTKKRRVIASLTPGDDQNRILCEWDEYTQSKGCVLYIPSLHERQEDIALLASHFLGLAAACSSRPAPEISTAALDALRSYRWPGSTRELEETMIHTLGTIPRSVSRLVISDLPSVIRGAQCKPITPSFPEHLTALEYEALRDELQRQRGNMTQTADALGLSPRQVSWRVKKYGINPREFKKLRLKKL